MVIIKMFACANLSFLFKEVVPLLMRYKIAAQAGFRFVECDFPVGVSPSELGEAVRENNLEQVLINCFQGDAGEMGFAATPGEEKAFHHSLDLTLEYAKATNCKIIHILSGPDMGPEHKKVQLETLEQNLLQAANKLRDEGVVGVIEPINPYSKPGYFLNSYETAVSVVKSVSSPHILLQLDIFHLQMITGNVTNNIEKLMPYTGHVQIAQSPTRHEPSFEGELNMKYVLTQLKKAGYEGPIGCEYIPSGSTINTLDWIKEYGLEF